MDASSIYGSSKADAAELRETSGGLLKLGRVSGTQLGTLPSCSVGRTQNIGMCTGCSKCFFAGSVFFHACHGRDLLRLCVVVLFCVSLVQVRLGYVVKVRLSWVWLG